MDRDLNMTPETIKLRNKTGSNLLDIIISNIFIYIYLYLVMFIHIYEYISSGKGNQSKNNLMELH